MRYGPDEVTYTLDKWSPDVLAELATELKNESIEHTWDGVQLIVPAGAEAEVDAALDDFEERHPFGGASDVDTKSGSMQCPYCAESIQRAALVCRHCGARSGPTGWVAGQSPSAERTSGYAIASLVLGILWLWFVGSALALVFGYMARREIDSSDGTVGGRGMATAGIILGWIGVVVPVVGGMLLVAASFG